MMPSTPTTPLSKKTWVTQMSRCIGSYYAYKQFAVMREVTLTLPKWAKDQAAPKPPHYKPGKYRLDIVAVNRTFETVVIETKSCRSDFQQDNKWQAYLPLCHKFYFAADPKTAAHIADFLKTHQFARVGVIAVSTTPTCDLRHRVRIIKPARTVMPCLDERDLLWRMAARGSGFNFVGHYYSGNTLPRLYGHLMVDLADWVKRIRATRL